MINYLVYVAIPSYVRSFPMADGRIIVKNGEHVGRNPFVCQVFSDWSLEMEDVQTRNVAIPSYVRSFPMKRRKSSQKLIP